MFLLRYLKIYVDCLCNCEFFFVFLGYGGEVSFLLNKFLEVSDFLVKFFEVNINIDNINC